MAVGKAQLRVALGGTIEMQLRPSELRSIAAGLGEFDASDEGNLITLAEALRKLPTLDRAPLWELAIRRFGRRKPLLQAAGEIGMDRVHAEDLIQAYERALARVPPPEHNPNL